MTIARLTLLLAAFAFALAPPPLGAAPSAEGAPRVRGVAVTSEAGADTTYARGETIRVTVTFTEAVTVDSTGGTPRLSIDMDPAAWGEKRALYAGGSGTAVLVFAHTVVEPNLSTGGVAVLANTLATGGGTIRSASGADAALGHGGLAHDPAHKVDWRISPDSGAGRDTTPPRLLRGAIDGATMTLTFSEALDPDSTGGSFHMGIEDPEHGVVGFIATGEVAVDGATVTVGMGAGYPRAMPGLKRNDVLYSRPADGGGGALRDLAGNPVLTTHAMHRSNGERWRYVRIDLENVTGGVPAVARDTTPPRLLRGEVDGGTMRLFFSEALDPGSTGGRFMVDLSTARLTSNFDATGPVSVAGNVVSVGLGAGNPRAEAGRLDHNRVLYIPNRKIWSEIIENRSAERVRRVEALVKVSYRQPLEQIFSWNFDPRYPRQIFVLSDGAVNRPERVIELAT